MGTDAKEDKVIGVDLVAAVRFDVGEHGRDQGVVDHLDFVTMLADKVVMWLFACQFVDDLIALQVSSGYQAKPHEKV